MKKLLALGFLLICIALLALPVNAPTPTPPYEVVTPTGITIPIWLILLALACIATIGYIIVVKRH